MLEAFQASAKAEEARQAEVNAADGSTAYEGGDAEASEPGGQEPSRVAGAGGPFAGTTEPVSAEPAVRPDANINPSDLIAGAADPTDSSLRRALSGGGKGLQLGELQLPVLVVGVLVAMLAMFFLGRWFSSPDETKAAGPGSEVGELAGTGDASNALSDYNATVDRRTTHHGITDREFLHRKNRLSVRAIEFPADERGSALALATYEYLLGLGLPAVAPITQGDVEVICVGAAPSRNAELERIRTTLRSLPGPPPQNESGAFESAFFVNIEDQIDDEYRIGNP